MQVLDELQRRLPSFNDKKDCLEAFGKVFGTTRTIERVLPTVRNFPSNKRSKMRYYGRRGVGKQPLANSLNAERP